MPLSLFGTYSNEFWNEFCDVKKGQVLTFDELSQCKPFIKKEFKNLMGFTSEFRYVSEEYYVVVQLLYTVVSQSRFNGELKEQARQRWNNKVMNMIIQKTMTEADFWQEIIFLVGIFTQSQNSEFIECLDWFLAVTGFKLEGPRDIPLLIGYLLIASVGCSVSCTFSYLFL